MKTTTAFVIGSFGCALATGCSNSSSSPADGGTTSSSSGAGSSSGSTTGSSSGTASSSSGSTSSGTSSSSGSSSGTSSSSGSSSGTSSGGDGGIPPVPTLGTQIDRMGRPAVNTALNNEFNALSESSTAMTAANAAKDMYNADRNPADWATNWVPTFEASLAIFDGLDGVCGNQLAYGALTGLPGYTSLSTVLANDALWLNTASSTCTTYLAVEANALGVTNTDCGGRTLGYNTIDATYNAVAGTLSFTTPPGPVTNGVTSASVAPSTTFPFLASPH